MKTGVVIVGVGAVATLVSGCAQPGDESPGPRGPIGAAPPSTFDAEYRDGVFDGPAVNNLRGDYQAQITIEGGRIVTVAPIVAGTDAPESIQTNSFALPGLIERVLEAQSADVDHVSGSSFTSPAFLESVARAMDQALVEAS